MYFGFLNIVVLSVAAMGTAAALMEKDIVGLMEANPRIDDCMHGKTGNSTVKYNVRDPVLSVNACIEEALFLNKAGKEQIALSEGLKKSLTPDLQKSVLEERKKIAACLKSDKNFFGKPSEVQFAMQNDCQKKQIDNLRQKFEKDDLCMRRCLEIRLQNSSKNPLTLDPNLPEGYLSMVAACQNDNSFKTCKDLRKTSVSQKIKAGVDSAVSKLKAAFAPSKKGTK